MIYKDISIYRTGRLECQVVQVWVKEYKENVLQNLINQNFRLLLNEHNHSIAFITVDILIDWLASNEGHRFIEKAFDVVLNTHRVIRPVWEEGYQEQTMSNIIYRTQDTVSDEIYEKITKGEEDVSEICIDTLIGWLNTYVGRCFIREAYGVSIPQVAEDGSD